MLDFHLSLRVTAIVFFFHEQIKCLENENELLEKNEKYLKESMEGLVQSREAFIEHYEAGVVYLYVCPFFWANGAVELNPFLCLLSTLDFRSL